MLKRSFQVPSEKHFHIWTWLADKAQHVWDKCLLGNAAEGQVVYLTASHMITYTHAWAFIMHPVHGYLCVYSFLSELLILSINVKKWNCFCLWLNIKKNYNNAHKPLFYALHVIVEKIHILSLQIKLAVIYAKFPLNKGKFGIVRKNIPFQVL